jgi:hypothetical protein
MQPAGSTVSFQLGEHFSKCQTEEMKLAGETR